MYRIFIWFVFQIDPKHFIPVRRFARNSSLSAPKVQRQAAKHTKANSDSSPQDQEKVMLFTQTDTLIFSIECF